jgi:hypothetical protein
MIIKVYQKYIKKISVEGHQFYYVVNDEWNRDYVKLRIYSTRTKTSFFDVFFTWKDNYFVSFYRPRVCAALIKYAIDSGWNHLEDRQTMIISQGSFLMKELDLDNL